MTCEQCGAPTTARWCSTRCQRRSDVTPSHPAQPAALIALKTALRQHPDLLNAMADIEAGRPAPDLALVGNARRAA